MFAINPRGEAPRLVEEQATGLLDDTLAMTAAVEEAARFADAESEPGSVLLVIDASRFNGMTRIQAMDAGSYNASFLSNKLRDLDAKGLENLSHYFAETASELRERAFRLRSEALVAQTTAWREAGCPGLVQTPTRETPVSSERKAESALHRLKAMIAKSEGEGV